MLDLRSLTSSACLLGLFGSAFLGAQTTTLQGSLGSSRAHSQTSTLLRAWFAANDGTHGMELWSCDWLGMPRMEFNLEPDGFEPKSSFPTEITNLGNNIVGGPIAFVASTQAEGREVRVFDGGPLRTITARPGGASSSPAELTAMGQGLAFTAVNDSPSPTAGRLFWSSDLATAQTVGTGAGLQDPYGLRRFGNRLMLLATTHGITELHTYTPGATTTQPLRGLGGQPFLDPTPAEVSLFGVYFTARDAQHADRKVFHWNGATPPVEVGLPSGSYTDPDMLTVVGIGEVVFRARVSGQGPQLFRGQGPHALQVSQFAAPVGASLGKPTTSAFDVWFTGADSSGHELFGLVGNSILPVPPLRAGGGAEPRHLVATPSGAWFSALRDGSDDRELWHADRSGQVTIRDLRPGPKSSSPTQFHFELGLPTAVADRADGRELNLLSPQGITEVPINLQATSDINLHIEPRGSGSLEFTLETDPGALCWITFTLGPVPPPLNFPPVLSNQILGLPMLLPTSPGVAQVPLGFAGADGIFRGTAGPFPPPVNCMDPIVLSSQAGSALTTSGPFKLSDPATFVSGCARSGPAQVDSTGSFDDSTGEYVIRSRRTDPDPSVHWLTLARFDRTTQEHHLLESRQIGPGETMVWTGQIDLDLPITSKDELGDRLYLFFTDAPPSQSLLQQLTSLAVAWFSYC